MDANDMKLLKPLVDEREVLTERLVKDYGYTHQLLDAMTEDEFFEWASRVIPEVEPMPLSQTAKADAGKPDYTLVPPAILDGIAAVRAYGTEKYHDPDNWRTVSANRHWKAVLRHIRAMLDDRNAVDKESGLPHIDHALCDLAFLRQLMMEGKA